ncbi:MAG TPA: protease pro-enzyme activation domain-containing protein [Rhodanobacteraceae bacterium]|nr:protease pro-enzyme activation domain-containing protein [Rhodanobacteraceae bacterium]
MSLAAAAAASAATPAAPAIAHATILRQGDMVAGPLAIGQSMHIVVGLKLRNKAQLDAYISHRGFKPLTGEQFAAQYSPTAAQAQAVANFMKRSGFTNVQIAPNRLLVSGDAPAGVVQRAFHTSLISVKTHDGRMAYANSQAAVVPASLQSIVSSVLGLQTVHMAHTDHVVARPSMVQTNAVQPYVTGSMVGHNPKDFATIYGAGSTATASTVPVGVITQGSMTNVKSDFSKFLSQNGYGSIPLNVVTVNGGGTDTSGDGEWDLDTQDIVGISGGVKALYLYDIPTLSDANLTAGFNKAVTDDTVKVINVSIGGCETDAEVSGLAEDDSIFQQAVAQGQTFSISTGDSGADECGNGGVTPSWPANSQYVVAVSGTGLYTSGTTSWGGEVVWNELSSNEGATGGSPSTYEPQPSWQNGVGQNAGNSHRGLGDIAFDGDPNSGAVVIVDGSNQQIGGTSLSSPLFVGTWARALATNSSLGFAAPLIYSDAASNYSADFHDVTSGNNSGETAAAGWDYPTGFGSVNIANFVSHVAGGGGGGGGTNNPPVASFTDTVSGLTASFTDTSTDSDGTIASHSWTFGDGGTSTAANPSHTYAAGGTFTVTETVTDNDGAQDSVSHSVTVSSGGGGGGSSQLLGNPGWETGSASPWTMSSGTLCDSSCGESPHSGTYYAYLDGYGSSHTDNVSQTVTIPAGKTSATLTYYLHIDTAENPSGSAYDHLYVRVYSTSGTLLKTLATYSNLNANSGYTQHSNSMSAYIGKTVVVKFTGKEDSSLQTSFLIDDTALNVQ